MNDGNHNDVRHKGLREKKIFFPVKFLSYLLIWVYFPVLHYVILFSFFYYNFCGDINLR